MNAFQDLAEMTRDYGLIRYFAVTVSVVAALMVILFLWGRVPDRPEAPAEAPPPVQAAPQPTAPSSY